MVFSSVVTSGPMDGPFYISDRIASSIYGGEIDFFIFLPSFSFSTGLCASQNSMTQSSITR